MMKKITTFIITLLISATTVMMAQQADAEYKLIKRAYEVKNDGSMTYNYRKELKLNSQRAFFSVYGESFIVYNPEYQTLKINEAYTLRADGSRVYAPKNAFVEQLPSACADCGYYNAFREMVVVHTALEKGATIVLDYTITSKPGVLLDKIVFAEDAPVAKYEVSIQTPFDFYYSLQNATSKKVVFNRKPSKPGTIYTWTGTNLPQTTAEPYAPSAEKLYPVLFLSTVGDLNAMLPTDFSLPQTASVFVAGIGGDELDKAKKINEHVARNIRLNNVSLAQTGLRFRNAGEVWNANCGNAFEKTLVLNAMLRAAGFNCDVVFKYDTLDCNGHKFYFPKTEAVAFSHEGQNYELSALRASKIEPLGKSLNAQSLTTEDKLFVTLNGDALECNGTKGKKNMVKLADGYYALSIEQPVGGVTVLPWQLESKRNYPLVCGTTKILCHYTVEIPEKVRLVGKTVNITVSKPFGYMQIKIEQKGNTLEVVRTLSITQDTIPVSQYADFKAMMLQWHDANYKRLVFAVE